jgi:uncharacterized membrane protein
MTQPNTSPHSSRYWEIDALRGVAIILMIGFHLTWDMVSLGLVQVNMGRGPWPWFSRVISTMFLSLAGISLVISDSRRGDTPAWRKYLLRGLRIFGLAMVVTLVTYLTLGRGFVVFGILHLIGFSIVAAIPFLPYRHRWLSLILGLALLVVGSYVNRQTAHHPWLIWLGINQLGRPMADWYPVLPWFGMMLVGLWLGHTLYTDGERRFILADLSRAPVIRQLGLLGRHSLLIYMAHQPILMGIVFAISWWLAQR